MLRAWWVGALVLAGCGSAHGGTESTQSTLAGIGVTPDQAEDTALASIGPPPSEVLPAMVEPDSSIDIVVAGTAKSRPTITDDRVFMVGDSVLQGMSFGSPDSIDTYVGSLGWNITVDAVQGRFLNEGLDVLRKRKAEVHQVLVAMLGNNYEGDSTKFAERVDTMLSMFPDVKLFVMFTTPLFKDAQKEVNLVLQAAAAKDSRLVLIDWEAASRAYDGALRTDHIHPTLFGADLLAEMVGVVLGPSPDAPPGVTLPVVGSSTRPPLPAGTKTNKGENNSTPRPGTTVEAPVTSRPGTTTTTRAPFGTVPTTVRPATTTTTGTSSSTATTSAPPATTSPPRESSTSSPSTTSAPPSSSSSSSSSSPPVTDPPVVDTGR